MDNKNQNNEEIKTKIILLSQFFGFDVCKITKPEIPNQIQKQFGWTIQNINYTTNVFDGRNIHYQEF